MRKETSEKLTLRILAAAFIVACLYLWEYLRPRGARLAQDSQKTWGTWMTSWKAARAEKKAKKMAATA